MIRRMFIRIKHDPKLNRTRVQIVESVRIGKKVRQKILRHVGVAHNDGEVEVIQLSEMQLMEQFRADQTLQKELFSPTEYADLQEVVRKASRPEKLDVDLGDCRKETRLSPGLRDVMGTVYVQLGWNSLLETRRKSAIRIVWELVLAHLSQRESRRATVEALANQAGIALNLDSIYRSMEYLDAPMIDNVCRMSHEAAEKPLEGPVDVLFYDCTVLAFATEREDDQADEEKNRLLAKGFSKDGRHHRSQVKLALMVTSEGLPVGYELFRYPSLTLIRSTGEIFEGTIDVPAELKNFRSKLLDEVEQAYLFAQRTYDKLDDDQFKIAFVEAQILADSQLFGEELCPNVSVDPYGEFTFSHKSKAGYVDIGVRGEGELSYHVRNDIEPDQTQFDDYSWIGYDIPHELLAALTSLRYHLE